jgi:hypothetical protein
MMYWPFSISKPLVWVLPLDLLAGVAVDEDAVDPIAGLFVDRMERDAFGRTRRRVKADAAAHLAEFDEAFPLSTLGHLETPDSTQPTRVKRITCEFVPIQK